MYPVTSTSIDTGSTPIDPTPSNNYCVKFGQWTINEQGESTYVANPYILKSIKPYIPCESIALTSSTFFKKINTSGMDCCIYDSKEAFSTIFIFLDTKNLVNFSETSKCCYLATKTDIIWQYQLKKLLPNVCCLSKFTCTFTPEQQFQIVFKKLNDRKKPFIAQLVYVCERIKELDIIIDGPREPDEQGRFAFIDAQIDKTLNFTDNEGNCHFALNSITSMEFDIQEKFEIIIQSSETAKQNINLDTEPQVEEVEDDYDDHFGSYGGTRPQTQADTYGASRG